MLDGRFHAYTTEIFFRSDFHPLEQVSLVIDILLASGCALLLVQLLIQKTKVGLAIRGAAFDLTTASIMGINVRKLIHFVFVLAGGLAGMSGAFSGAEIHSLSDSGKSDHKGVYQCGIWRFG